MRFCLLYHNLWLSVYTYIVINREIFIFIVKNRYCKYFEIEKRSLSGALNKRKNTRCECLRGFYLLKSTCKVWIVLICQFGTWSLPLALATKKHLPRTFSRGMSPMSLWRESWLFSRLSPRQKMYPSGTVTLIGFPSAE